jgi:hypothetical protein
VPGHRQRQVLALDPGPVVGDGNSLDDADCELDVDLRRSGIERVLEQFLQRGGRAFDDLAGGDLVDQIGQRVNRAMSGASPASNA